MHEPFRLVSFRLLRADDHTANPKKKIYTRLRRIGKALCRQSDLPNFSISHTLGTNATIGLITCGTIRLMLDNPLLPDF